MIFLVLNVFRVWMVLKYFGSHPVERKASYQTHNFVQTVISIEHTVSASLPSRERKSFIRFSLNIYLYYIYKFSTQNHIPFYLSIRPLRKEKPDTQVIFFSKLSLGFILKLFLKFPKFQLRYSYNRCVTG